MGGRNYIRKIDFKLKTVTRYQDGHYEFIKVIIHQEDISFIKTYSPNISLSMYEANIDRTEKRKDNKTKEDFNTSFSVVDKKSRQMINKGTET